MNSRLVEMIARGRLPFRGWQWIDTYNQITDPDCAGTIIAGINAKNHYYVMEEMKDNTQNYVIEQRGHGFVPSSQKEIRPTITGATFNYNNTLNNGYRIRKLTPRECFRLMGVSDADIDKIQAAGISKSQQYKMAGNSIVVNCLAAIFRQLFIGNFNKSQQTEIF